MEHPFLFSSASAPLSLVALRRQEAVSARPSCPSAGTTFFKSVHWSPDGAQLLSTTEDNQLIVHNVSGELIEKHRYFTQSTSEDSQQQQQQQQEQNLEQHLSVNAGSPIYDCQWFPGMRGSALSPESCCFITTCKDRPVQLWSAMSNPQVECSYVARNHLDELESSTSVSFNLQGNKIYAGAKSTIRVWDVENPGTACSLLPFPVSSGERSIVSTIEFNSDFSGAYAVGTYSHSITVFVEGMEVPALELHPLDFAVTCLRWSRDGAHLWAGGRSSNEIICWDLRHTRTEVGRVKRSLSSNQKMAFDLDPWSAHIVTGAQDGSILVYDTTTFSQVATHPPTRGSDCSNGVSLHPYSALLAVSSGQRHFNNADDETEDEADEESLNAILSAAAASMSAPVSCVSVFSMPFQSRRQEEGEQ